MKILYIVVILLLCSSSQTLATGNKCEKLLNELKQAGSLFFMCSMHFSVPVNFCINCSTDHSATVEQYQKLINASYHNNTTNTTEICKEKYFDQDRLNIVQTLYDEINGLWERAFCNECFDGQETPNNLTLKVLNQLGDVNSCLQNNDDPCIACQSRYLNLNDFYTQELEKKHNNKVCFDLQDAMNRTRFIWSKKLNCCDRVVDLTAFAAICSVMAVLPILFYISMYFYTKRVERNHDMLIDDFRSEAAPATTNVENNQVIPSQNNIDNTQVPGVSTREAPDIPYNDNIKKTFKISDSDSDDDNYAPKESKKLEHFDDSDDEPIITKESPTSKQNLSKQISDKTKTEPLIEL